MQLALIALALIAFVLAVLFGVWGIWLLTTPDYQGGRHPAGAMATAFAAAMTLLGIALVRASSRRRRA